MVIGKCDWNNSHFEDTATKPGLPWKMFKPRLFNLTNASHLNGSFTQRTWGKYAKRILDLPVCYHFSFDRKIKQGSYKWVDYTQGPHVKCMGSYQHCPQAASSYLILWLKSFCIVLYIDSFHSGNCQYSEMLLVDETERALKHLWVNQLWHCYMMRLLNA